MAAMVKETPELSKHGTNQIGGVKLLKSSSHGPTSEYLVARIRRDRPDIADRHLGKIPG